MPDIPIRAADTFPPLTEGSFHCDFLWDSLTILSDGNVTCGFDDPFGTRSYGNIATGSLREMFGSEPVRERRRRLVQGTRCMGCHQYSGAASLGAAGLPPVPEMPRRLIVESTIRCNLRCRNVSCDVNNDRRSKVRDASFLSFELFRKALDEAGPTLKALYFFNYGEPFLHPRAVDMLAYAREVNPELYVATSTNGLLIRRNGTARRIVEEELLYWMNFTIAGSDDPTYQLYHKGGSFEQAVDGMRAVIEEKRRLGRRLPTVRWRYLLFNWNDDDEQLARARALAAEIGVDEFTFMLCSGPLEGRTRRRAPGTPGYAAIADAVEYEVHYRPDVFGDAGLYGPEFDPLLGTYCWTARRAVVKVTPHGRTARVFLARTAAIAQAGAPVTLRTPWGERPARVGEETWACNEIRVPEASAGVPFEVELAMEQAHIPFRHTRDPDYRELGVMLSLAIAESPVAVAPAFAPCEAAPPGAWIESDPVRVCGIRGAASVWTENGEYAIGEEGEFTDAAGLVFDGEWIRVRHRAAAGPGMGTTTVLTVGGVPAEFTSVTSAWAPWCEPAPKFPAAAPVQGDLYGEVVAAFVDRLYRGVLGREPDAPGSNWWCAALHGGTARADAIAAFLDSAEFRDVAAPAVRLYLAFAQRNPDPASLRAWVRRHRAGVSLEALAWMAVGRGEFALRYAGISHANFVERLHQDLLGAKPGAGVRSRLLALRSRDAVLLAITGSEAYRARSTSQVRVAVLYVGMLARPPDPGGYDFWVRRLDAGGSLRELVEAVLSSKEGVVGRPLARPRSLWPILVAQ